MGLTWVGLDDLIVEDERSFGHVAIYGELKRWLRAADIRFGVLGEGRSDHATLLNLAFWRPGAFAEVLESDVITADQVAHNAWHAIAAAALGEDARSVQGLLLAESIASAFDIYLVGRLLGHAPESSFLSTQVPAMADAALDAGLTEAELEALVEEASASPEASFEALRSLLFDVACALVACDGLEAAEHTLRSFEDRPHAALLNHYELPTWVLFARCYGAGDGSRAREVDAALRSAPDSLAWLEDSWLRGLSA
jgi:hypothetical protein